MKALNYTRYFFYIALNWNARLAFYTLYHEIRGELKYDLSTTGINDLTKLTLKGKYRSQAEVYQGANFKMMETMFDQLRTRGVSESIVDLGCGKGRVLVVAAHFGFHQITGVEFAEELWQDAVNTVEQARKYFPKTSFSVLHENAANYQVDNHCQVFFFFNPFQEVVMKKVIGNILRSYEQAPRPIYVIYINPQLKQLFIEANFKEIHYLKPMSYVEASLLLLQA